MSGIKRCSPVRMREIMKATDALVKGGITYVPMPVLSEDDYWELWEKSGERLDTLTEESEKLEEKR